LRFAFGPYAVKPLDGTRQIEKRGLRHRCHYLWGEGADQEPHHCGVMSLGSFSTHIGLLLRWT
jgi:hypothetical protein